VQAAEKGYLRKVHGVKLRDKARDCEIHEALNVESLFLCIEKSQLRWAMCPEWPTKD